MKLTLSTMEETIVPEFKGGTGRMIGKMYTDELCKITLSTLEPGSSVGMHTHETNSETMYIVSGTGKAIYDGTEELLEPGDCHYCPKGHTHSLINTGEDNLVYFAVIPEQ